MCSRYALSQVDANRLAWESRHASEDDFVANMSFTEAEMAAFKAHVLEEGVEIDDDEWVQSLPAIELRLKAFYARNIYDSKSFYRVIGGLNEAPEAIRVLNDGTFNARTWHKRLKDVYFCRNISNFNQYVFPSTLTLATFWPVSRRATRRIDVTAKAIESSETTKPP